MLGNKLINTNAGGGCTDTVDLYNPFPDGGGIALYQLNGNATDVSGNYDGTATNVTYGAGEFGQAGVFNGSSSYIKAPNPLYTGFPLTNYTVSAWFKINAYGDQFPTIFVTQTGGTTLPPYLWIDSSILRAHGYTYNDYTNTLSIGTWYNAVMVNSGTTTELYLNGVLQTPTSRNTYTTTTGEFFGLGGVDQYPNTTSFDGSIDQVRVFTRALRPYEIEALYTEEYCTPTIVPSEHFNTVTYTGDGQPTRSITGVGFQPDLVWIKQRGPSNSDNVLNDSVRGVNKKLASNTTTAEVSPSIYGAVSSFDADGFSLAKGTDNTFNGGFEVNTTYNGATYVAWNFKAGGAEVAAGGTNLTNRFVSANPEAGFSIMTYTGSGTDGTIEHGLNAKPELWIFKNLSVAKPWFTLTNIIDGSVDYGFLNTTDAFNNAGQGDATDTILNVNLDGGSGFLNANGNNYVAYAFHSVEGFSNFGSYVGNGTSKTIVTGFEPAFVMFKVTSEADHWLMFDNKRGVVTDETGTYLIANLSQAEGSILPSNIKFLANGFEITGSGTYWNKANASYIYMAFAADPTTIEPSLEDSFNTVLYTGNATARSITGVGFQPDFTWIKNRNNSTNSTWSHSLFDSVRTTGWRLRSDSTGAENDYSSHMSGFTNNGFNLTSSGALNDSSGTYVAWNWKGAELPAINSNGSITSVVSANPAAGFSIVNWRAGSTIGNVGHGLNAAPDMIIVKQRDGIQDWWVWHNQFTGNQAVKLNTTDAIINNPNIFGGSDVPNATTFAFNGSSGADYIAYVFHSVEGFSKIGFWQGGTTSINLGFEPAFVLNHDYGAGGGWGMNDSVRGDDKVLAANTSNAESTSTFMNFNSTGFTVPSESSIVFRLYMAFANQF